MTLMFTMLNCLWSIIWRTTNSYGYTCRVICL